MLVLFALAPAFITAPPGQLGFARAAAVAPLKPDVRMQYNNFNNNQYGPNQYNYNQNRMGGRGGGPGPGGGGGQEIALSVLAFGLLCLVGYAPEIHNAKMIAQLFGYHIAGMGFTFVVTGFSEQQYSNYPLRYDGTYNFCRYPLYGGLVMSCVGAAMVTNSLPRLAATVLLYVGLSLKTRYDDKQLERMYGQDFYYWAASAPRLLPDFSDPERIQMAFSGRDRGGYGRGGYGRGGYGRGGAYGSQFNDRNRY